VRKLTLKGYLKNYVKKLSAQNTNDVYKLAAEAKKNFRLQEPLFLYAMSAGKLDLLSKSIKDNELHERLAKLAGAIDLDGVEKALESRSNALDDEYHKIYRSYVIRRDISKTDNHTKQLMHARIVKLQESKNVSNYRLYSDLKMNGANINAFLKHKATAKVSLDNLRKILNYLESV
jgi:hypothetical protein